MKREEEGDRYVSWMLRLWRDGNDCARIASLEDPHTGQRYHFPSVDRLLRFLSEQTASDESAS